MNHVQQRAMERLGVIIDKREIDRLTRLIIAGKCKRYLYLSFYIQVFRVYLNDQTEALAIFDSQYSVIKTIGHPSWIKRKGGRYIFVSKKHKQQVQPKEEIDHRRDKRPYDRTKYKTRTKEMLQRYD